MLRSLIGLVMLGLACSVGPAPSAGDELFHDDAERAEVGGGPAAQVGSYAVGQVRVVAASSGRNSLGQRHPDSPGEGANLLLIDRPASELGRRNMGTFVRPATSRAVRLELDALVQVGQVQFGLGSDEAGLLLNGQRVTLGVNLNADGSISAFGSNERLPDVSHTSGQWQHYVIEYELGARAFRLTAGNATATVQGPWAADARSVSRMDRVWFTGGTDLTVGYLDNLRASSVEPSLSRPTLSLRSVKMIWDEGPHNAFTDLVRYDGLWVCAFREAPAHAGGVPDSMVRVLVSEDGQSWRSVGELVDPRGDIRDAKLGVTPDGRLMVLTATQLFDTSTQRHQSLVFFTDDLETWDGPHDVGEPDLWLWGITWHEDVGYSIGYQTVPPRNLARMYTTHDGQRFDVHVPDLGHRGYPNESAIVFGEDGTAYCLLRRDRDDQQGQIGVARPPYTDWQWKSLNKRIGGPAMIMLPDGQLLATVRLYPDGSTMAQGWETWVCWVDPATGELAPALQLPSGGDTSYAGMVYDQDSVAISYYSSHEGKSKIYFARVGIGSQAPVGEVEVGETLTISVQPQYYHGWPSLKKLRDGRLMLLYSGGRADHLCPFGRMELLVSRDEGQTWLWPRVLHDSFLDDRDAGLVELSNGTLLLTLWSSTHYLLDLNNHDRRFADMPRPERDAMFARWRLADERTTEAQKAAEQGAHAGRWMKRSTDGGLSWSERWEIPGYNLQGPIQLTDGRLLHAGTSPQKAAVWESFDEGTTWELLADLPTRAGEMDMIQAADGRLVLHVRGHQRDGFRLQGTFQTESFDGGRTWSEPRLITRRGWPAQLQLLSDETLLVTYGYRTSPYGVRGKFSKDHGSSWSEAFVIYDQGANWDLGYPSTVELSDGSLMTVWYEKMDGSPNAVLRQANWRLTR